MAIKRPTTFVLGAGASLTYDFPLGVKLRNEVLGLLRKGSSRGRLIETGCSEAEIDAFFNDLRRSARRSVDEYLEHNPDYLVIGKRAIAAALLPHENPEKIFPPGAPMDHHWYEWLIRHMEVGTDGWHENRLSVVTFNYDRSLEHYFTSVIANRTKVARDEAYDLFERTVPVIHVHGTLGKYPETVSGGLPFGAVVTAENIVQAAESLLVVSEVEDTLPTFDEAYQVLAEAERIYFIGFGFHPDNVRRLRVFNSPGFDEQQVSGTTIGFTEEEWAPIVEGVLHGRWSPPGTIGHPPGNFLRYVAELD